MINRIIIFKGSKKDFNELLKKEITDGDEVVSYMELIQYYNKKLRQNDSASPDDWISAKKYINNCVVKSEDYASVLEHAVSNFVNIITLNSNVGNLFVHNPPKRVINSLNTQYSDIIEYRYSKYEKINRRKLKYINKNLNKDIIGQDECKRKIISSLYKLNNNERKKPVVLLLYGPSGVGKTETAKSISVSLGGNLLRVQFSMMQSQEAYNYVFGAEHSRSCFSKDLENRETNIILIDEFDKVNPIFYNAFYEMFDEGKFTDINYEVDVRNCIFICTTNFSNEEEIKERLGPAMFSRIGDCIRYIELNKGEKQVIVNNKYNEMLHILKQDERKIIENSNIKKWFIENADRYDNIRILKSKMENAIFEKLSNAFVFDNEN